MKVQRAIEIKAPPEKVWPFLIEPEEILKWYIPLKKFEYTSDKRSGVDATVYCEEKFRGQLLELNYVVTEWIENRRLAFTVTSGTLEKDVQIWSIEATPSGSRFTIFEDIKPPVGIVAKTFGILLGIVAVKIGEFFGRKSIGGIMEKMLTNLKSLAEA